MINSPMSNIDKQSLREKFEAWWEVNYHNGNPPRFGWEHWRDGDGYKIDDDESELDGMWESWQAAHSSKLEAEQRISSTWRKTAESNNEKLEAAERRIAELEARSVIVPSVSDDAFWLNFNGRFVFCEETYRSAVFKALDSVGIKNAAGITTKGE